MKRKAVRDFLVDLVLFTVLLGAAAYIGIRYVPELAAALQRVAGAAAR